MRTSEIIKGVISGNTVHALTLATTWWHQNGMVIIDVWLYLFKHTVHVSCGEMPGSEGRKDQRRWQNRQNTRRSLFCNLLRFQSVLRLKI